MARKLRGKKPGRMPEEPENVEFEWPEFFQRAEVQHLVRRVEEAADGEREKAVFTSLLRRAYEDVLELEMLYRDLPGVLADDLEATSSFQRVLAGAAGRGIGSGGGGFAAGGGFRGSLSGFRPDPNLFPRGPCQPRFLIRPTVFLLLREGVERISHGDRKIYDGYLNVLAGLWQRADRLERFHRDAVQGIDSAGRNRLAEGMRLLARDSRFGGTGRRRLPGEPGSGELGGVPPEDDAGFGGLIPGEDGAGQLPPGGLWPPPSDPVDFPPEGPPSGFPPDFCELVENLCQSLVLDGLGRIRPLPESTNVDGITGIFPETACAGQTITILGMGFGNAQPPNIVVVIGGAVAPVVSWSDTEIVITVPELATSGCVGFRDETIEAERRRLHQINQQAVQDLNTGLRCLGTGEAFPNFPYFGSSPPCVGFNYFSQPLPRIDWFRVNGTSSLTVESGTELTLTWQVPNAPTVRIRRISADGPPIDVTNPSGGVLSLGTFGGNQPEDAVYQITATNPCGTAQSSVRVSLRTAPALSVAGVEVVQTIQRFSLTNSGQNNSVALVANKRTIARVYVDSGIRNNFDYGAGPNLLNNVTGEIIIWPSNANRGFGAGAPLNAGGVVVARPAAQIDRTDLTHTLNFELPVDQLSGAVRISVRLGVEDGANQFGDFGGWTVSDSSTVVPFLPRQGRIVVPIRIRDDSFSTGPVAAPSIGDYATTLQGARTRYPIPEDGFTIMFAPGFEVIGTTRDLTATNDDGTLDPSGWQDLLDDIEDISDDFQDIGQIWTGLTPNDSRYNAIGGIANLNSPHLVSRTLLGAAFTQELTHTFNIKHAPCGLPSDETPDPRLPGRIEDQGMDVAQRQLVPAGTGEVMSYCGGKSAWTSIALWKIMFGKLN